MVRQTLYPPVDPFESGMIEVGQGHRIYWEQCGSRAGVPVLFLHGGPGAGCTPGHRRFFDPAHYRAVLFDQRGAGRSRPTGRLEGNTTQALIDDIELLRCKLEIEKWIVFGGSWGSTLALAYGQAHPERCLALVLRGVFLARQKEIKWFMEGMENFFPEEYRQFAGFLSEELRGDVLKGYLQLMNDPDEAVHLPAAQSWAKFEAACATLLPNPDMVNELNDPITALGLGRLEAHYFANGMFLEEGQLLQNADRLSGIPGVIVQGRYDVICPPISARDLADAWPEAELVYVSDAGHSATEPGITIELVRAMERLKTL